MFVFLQKVKKWQWKCFTVNTIILEKLQCLDQLIWFHFKLRADTLNSLISCCDLTEQRLLPCLHSFSPYIMASVWPIDHPVSFSFSHSLFQAPHLRSSLPPSLARSLAPLPSSPQHLHRTLCPGQPLIIFTHQNVDQLHFMRIENHKFCSAWTAPRLESCFTLFTSMSTSGTNWHIKRGTERGAERKWIFSECKVTNEVISIIVSRYVQSSETEAGGRYEFSLTALFLCVSALSGCWHLSITLWASYRHLPRSLSPNTVVTRTVHDTSWVSHVQRVCQRNTRTNSPVGLGCVRDAGWRTDWQRAGWTGSWQASG